MEIDVKVTVKTENNQKPEKPKIPKLNEKPEKDFWEKLKDDTRYGHGR